MVGKRKRLTLAGNQLRHLLDHATASEDLTEEERDWAATLRDRFFALANRIPRNDPEGRRMVTAGDDAHYPREERGMSE